LAAQRVNIGDVELEAVLERTGPVTVIFENGLGMPLEEWDAVVGPIAARARLLRYEHRPAAPVGPIPKRTATETVRNLNQLLSTMGVAPPYAVVGHSWGGVVARVFADSRRDQVAGLVLVDATHEAATAGLALVPVMYAVLGFATRFKTVRARLIQMFCPPGSSEAYRARIERSLGDYAAWIRSLRTVRAEAGGVMSSLAELRRTSPNLPNVPVQVLTAGSAKSLRRVHEAWKATVSRASNAHYTNLSSSGHYLPIEAPQIVISAITCVLDSIGTRP
jgi:pimeloyl-ACP methyl ester carboxylesterase